MIIFLTGTYRKILEEEENAKNLPLPSLDEDDDDFGDESDADDRVKVGLVTPQFHLVKAQRTHSGQDMTLAGVGSIGWSVEEAACCGESAADQVGASYQGGGLWRDVKTAGHNWKLLQVSTAVWAFEPSHWMYSSLIGSPSVSVWGLSKPWLKRRQITRLVCWCRATSDAGLQMMTPVMRLKKRWSQPHCWLLSGLKFRQDSLLYFLVLWMFFMSALGTSLTG